MKKKLQLLFLFSLPICLSAQKTKITTIEGAIIIENNEEKPKSFTVYKNNYNKENVLIASKLGYANAIFKLDTILNQNLAEYQIKLNPILPLDFNKVKNKLVFSGFVDKLEKIKMIEYTSPNTYRYVNLSGNEFKSGINSYLSEMKFKLIEENEVFKSKSNNADYALGGEIIDYKTSTKGPGFITSLYVKWSLYDVHNEETVLKISTAGYSNTQTRLNERQVLALAMKDALGAFIINPEVSKFMYGNNDSEDNANLKQQINIAKIKTIGSENNFIEKAIQSSLTIKSNSGHGSGFLISTNGYLLTNFHVIEDSTDLQAVFQNGLTLPLTIISFDKKADVAVCKIPGKGYTALPLDSNSVIKKIGNDVVAIGTPEDLKLGQTVTKGIISGLREIKSNIYIQTDVSINSGNSGGMLINKNGDVIGIITAKMKGEGVEGLGFAIPIAKAINALNIKITE